MYIYILCMLANRKEFSYSVVILFIGFSNSCKKSDDSFYKKNCSRF